jgi:hypothetical protein
VNAGNWIELAALLVTILGGGGVGVGKLTRIAVTIENAGKTLEALGKTLESADSVAAAHTAQLAVHEVRLTAVEGQLQHRP